jgi:hypothetical protein
MSMFSKLVIFTLLSMQLASVSHGLARGDDERKQSQVFKAELKKETSGTVPAKSRSGDSCLEGRAKRGDMRINPVTGHIQLCH